MKDLSICVEGRGRRCGLAFRSGVWGHMGTVHLRRSGWAGGMQFEMVVGLQGVVGFSYLGGTSETLWGKVGGKKQEVVEQSAR